MVGWFASTSTPASGPTSDGRSGGRTRRLADGTRLFLSRSGPNVGSRMTSPPRSSERHAPRPSPLAAAPSLSASLPPRSGARRIDGGIEIVVLDTGVRIPINDELSVWGEWSRDGGYRLLATGGHHRRMAGTRRRRSSKIGRAQLSSTFFRNYVFFAGSTWNHPGCVTRWWRDRVQRRGGGCTRYLCQPLGGDRTHQ